MCTMYTKILCTNCCDGRINNLGSTWLQIDGDKFLINGRPTYEGCGKVEGLLFNLRTVNATFDDTLGIKPYWDDDGTHPENDYASYGRWESPASAFANTERFIQALAEYREHGILAVNLNFQGGHPLLNKPWFPEGEGSAGRRPNGQRDFLHNSGFHADGTIDPNYARRISSVIEACDRLGMVVILQIFYFGQDTVFPGEEEIKKAVDNAVDFIGERGYRNVIIEIANETMQNHYHHAILKPGRMPELILRARNRYKEKYGRDIYVSTSEAALLSEKQWQPAEIDAVYSVSDLIILHGPGELKIEGGEVDAREPRRKVELFRAKEWYLQKPRPILFNESAGQYAFEYAVEAGVSWGLHSGTYLQTVWPPKWGVWNNGIRWYFERVKELTSK